MRTLNYFFNLLIVMCLAFTANAAVCTQTFTVSGNDDDPTVLTITAADISCNAGGVINSLTLVNAAGNTTNANCGSWYDYTLVVDAGPPVTGCAAALNATVITGFTSLTITSADLDVWSDAITITIDVEVDFTPAACPSPSLGVATAITGNSANLGWTENGTSTVYDVEWGTSGFTPTGTPSVGYTGVANPVALSGLSGLTTYDFYVRADCGASGGTGVSPWAGPFAFTTACSAEIPDYIEDFTTYLDVCWDEGAGPVAGPTIGATNWVADGFAGVGATGSARYNIYLTGDEAWLISPVFDLTGGGFELNMDVSLNLWASTSGTTIDTDDFVHVMQSTDGGTTWSIIYTWDNANSPSATGDNVTIDVSAVTSATTQFALLVLEGATSSADMEFYMDNFQVRTPPSCAAPSALMANSITTTSASLAWTENGTNNTYDVEWGTAGFTPTGAPSAGFDDITTNPATLSGLTAATAYDYYVRSDCDAGTGSGQSTWAGPFTFTTALPNDDCAGAISLPVNLDLTCTLTTTFINNGATFSATEGAPSGACVDSDPAPLDIWFSAVVPAGGELYFEFLSNPGFSSLVELYTGTCGGGLTALAPVNCGNSAARIFTGLTPSSTVYFRVWDYSSDEFGSGEICLQGLDCVPPTATTLVVDDCANSQFSVTIDVTDMGSGTSYDIQDGAATSVGTANAVGTYTVGPFPNGTPVDLTLVHNTNTTCNVTGAGLINGNCPDIVACGGAASNVSGVCYATGTIEEWWFQSDNGSALNINVIAGQVENTYDEFEVYDGTDATGTLIYSGYGTLGDLAGLTFNSTSQDMYIRITPDGSTDCGTSGYTPLNFDITCLACTAPTATFTEVPNCGSNEFSIDVDVTDLGSATSIAIDTNGVLAATITAISTTTVGPFASGASVTVDLVHNIDNACDLSSPVITSICPPSNDDIAGAIQLTLGNGSCAGATTGTNIGATDSGVSHSCASYSGGDLWYYVIVPASGEFSVEGYNIDWTDGGMQAYSGPSNALVSINCDDDDGVVNMPAIFPADGLTGLTPGDTIWFAIWEYGNNAFGEFEICAYSPPPPPANDECANATPLTCGQTLVGESTVNSTSNGGPTGCSLGFGVWYSFLGNGDDVTVTSPTTFDHELAIASSSDCITFSNVLCQDGSTGTETATFSSVLGTTYYIYVAHYSTFGNTTGTFDIGITCTTPPPPGAITWNGSVDDDWTDAANWTGGVPPFGCADNIFIPDVATQPSVAASQDVGELTLASNAGVTVQAGGSLNVCGDVTLGSGCIADGDGPINLLGTGSGTSVVSVTDATVNNMVAQANYSFTSGTMNITNSLTLDGGNFTNAGGSVVLVSDAAGTAYFDDFTNPGNSYTGDLTVQRYVTNGFAGGLGQRYFGSAVDGGVVSGLDGTYASGYPTGQIMPNACDPNMLMAGSPYSNLFEWNEVGPYPTTCEQEGWFAISAAAGLANGRAYSGWMNNGSTLEVTGTPNTAVTAGDISYGALGATAPAALTNARGWHLLANPFPSPMNIDAVTADGFTSPQYYNAASGAYSGTFQPALVAGSEVPVMQGFVAQTAGPNTFTPSNAERIAANNANFAKSTAWYDYMLEVEVDVNGSKDITYLYYSGNSTAQFDNATDCIKRHSDLSKPTLFTKLGSDELSLNGFHLNDLGTSIPMGLVAPELGTYTFNFTGMNDFPANTTIYVEDLETGTYHNIADGVYTFNADPANNGTDRFMIHFVLPASFNLVEPTCENVEGTIIENTTDGRNLSIINDGVEVETGILDGSSNILTSGDYTIEVYDQYGGNQSYDFVIEEFIAVNAGIIASQTSIEEGEAVNFDFLGNGANNYQWSIDGQIVAQTELFAYTFNTPGEYVVEVFGSNENCEAMATQTISVSEKTTSIVNIGNKGTLNIFESNGNVVLDFNNVNEGETTVRLFNMLGQEIASKDLDTNGKQTIENRNWATGIYIVKMEIAGKSISETLLLTK